MRITGLGDINTVAQTIQTVEGYYPGSIAYTNNNPGNLKYAGQPGATPGAGGFAVFPNYNTGYQALLNQISLDAGNGLTIAQFTSKYAPAGDGSNNPASYAQTIAQASGLSVNDPLSSALGDTAGAGAVTSYLLSDPSTGVLTDPATGDTVTTDWTGVILLAGIALTLALI